MKGTTSTKEMDNAHPCCFLPNATVAARDDNDLPRLIRDILRSPGWLGRKELAEGPNSLL